MYLSYRIKQFVKGNIIPIICLMGMFYCSFQAINGEKGLRQYFKLKQELIAEKKVAEEIALRRAELEQKVSLLKYDNVDRDIVDELARSSLNMANEGDFVIVDFVE